MYISIKMIFIYFLFEEGWIIASQKKERRKNVRTRDKNNIEFCVFESSINIDIVSTDLVCYFFRGFMFNDTVF